MKVGDLVKECRCELNEKKYAYAMSVLNTQLMEIDRAKSILRQMEKNLETFAEIDLNDIILPPGK